MFIIFIPVSQNETSMLSFLSLGLCHALGHEHVISRLNE